MKRTAQPLQPADYLNLGFQAPWLVINEIARFLSIPWLKLKFAFYQIPWKKGYKIYGSPIIQRWRGSKIVFGNNLELRSTTTSNPLAPNHPVVISTRASQAKITIGSHFAMTGGSMVAQKSISIGNHVIVGANCLIIDTDFHPLNSMQRKINLAQGSCAPVVINDRVFIGANSVVLKGVTIGAGCVIGAGSVVCKSIPAGIIAAGTPAKVIRRIS